MAKYLQPTRDGDNFTKAKPYKIEHEYGGGRYLVTNDKGEKVIVRADGQPSARLNWDGKFEPVSDDLNNALNIQAKAEALAMREQIRENVRSIVGNAIKSNDFWAVRDKPATARIVTNADFKRDLVYTHNGKQIKVQEACETLDALKEILRCSDWSELKMQAQISRTMADALVKLQNSTNC